MTTGGPPPVDEPVQADSAQLLKMLVELGPIVVFFVVNTQSGIFWGTGAFMIATVVALVVSRVLFGRLPIMPLVSGVFVLVFGGLTLWLQDEQFIKIKPTIVNLLFAGALLGGLAFGLSLIKYVFGEAMKLTDVGWRILTFRWGLFFIFLALLNELVWRTCSTNFWLSFKAWGIMPLTIAFAIAQIGLVKQHGAGQEPR